MQSCVNPRRQDRKAAWVWLIFTDGLAFVFCNISVCPRGEGERTEPAGSRREPPHFRHDLFIFLVWW